MRRQCYEWNFKPANILQAPWRVWDWKDPAFLRGVEKRSLPR